MSSPPSFKHILILFAAVTLLAYGLLLPFTGFYWDDWPFAWIAKFLGPAEFIPAFSGVRPFLGPIFFVTTSLIPPVPIYWQAFALVVRFLAGLSAWFALKQSFPRHPRQALITSLLFLVFPGYSQHWVAFTHINQEWIPFIFYLLSFGFSARAIRRSFAHPTAARMDMFYALLLLVAGVFPTEYFIGLEPMRFLFIWAILSDEMPDLKQRFVQSLKRWFPYLLIWLVNALWLAYFYTLGSYESYEVAVVHDPLTLAQILSVMGDALWKTGFYIWGQVIVLIVQTLTAPTSLLTLVLILLSFFPLFYFLNRSFSPTSASGFARQAIFIGFIGILLGRVPSWVAGLPLTLQSSFDRLMISMMLGGSLFIVGLVEILVKDIRARNLLFAMLTALGIGQQFFNGNIFRRDWQKQGEIYWQMAWRMPALKPNTVLLAHQMPIDYETDLSFTAPLNWMYAPDYTRASVPYALLYTEKRLGTATLPSLEKDTEIKLGIRTVGFSGSTSQAVVIYMPPHGCLRVLDPQRGDAEIQARWPETFIKAISLSDPSRILTETDRPAVPMFFPEPEHDWCYYFTKAELARQNGDYELVARLGNEAMQRGFKPEDPTEWLVFIEAYLVTGDLERAKERSYAMLQEEARTRRSVCALWQRVQAQGLARSEAEEQFADVMEELGCAR